MTLVGMLVNLAEETPMGIRHVRGSQGRVYDLAGSLGKIWYRIYYLSGSHGERLVGSMIL